MYTQCPKCLTYFQVTAEHLKVAQGNVRCGQCSNVFSALGNLSEVPPQQNNDQQKSQAPGKSSASKQPTPRPSPQAAVAAAGTKGSNPQSKLTNAIAAIQALNQSSQKILSQGRKNYIAQLQKQAQAQRKMPSSGANDSTARNLSEEDIEAISQIAARAEADSEFDIEEALAAVEGLEVDDDDSPIQYGVSDDEDITPAYDGSHLVEDYKNEKAEKRSDSPKGKKRAKVIKTDAVDDDIFDFSEFDLPDEEIKSDTKKKTQQKKSQPKKKGKTAGKSAGKKSARKKTSKPGSRPVTEDTFEEVTQNDIPAKQQPAAMAQNVISDPDVVIENNIPTLAIPKALLEDFEKEKVSHANYRSMLTWGGLSLLMMLIFLSQAIYFKHNELGQISQLRPWVEMFCKHASCELSLQVDIGQIELLGQDIRSHPKSDGALLVSATIINNASFTQPYPGLQLSFSDINGEKVATRNFFPKDYLPSKFSDQKGMESNIPIQLELELVDPGKNAVNFEFDFFSI